MQRLFQRSMRLQEKGVSCFCSKFFLSLPFNLHGLQAEKLKKDILNKFPQNVNITLEGTPQVTGFMEVTVNGKLVHSKKNGDGYVNTPEKLEKIFAAIEASLSC
ncbi:Selenoprotein W [Trichinella pseudospiralis]|uniref:Selenoprotein W n=1 Tax=Trichinella pseudospiralis TaxID=6337 RepID=A0A0V0YKL4_TRIPS|nr:Selenoprotein W [Trichinella pseudospiralis]